MTEGLKLNVELDPKEINRMVAEAIIESSIHSRKSSGSINLGQIESCAMSVCNIHLNAIVHYDGAECPVCRTAKQQWDQHGERFFEAMREGRRNQHRPHWARSVYRKP